ncbi:DUF3788 domain-containing protein [bacterium]|nr:DUF3788 domain-containing protein [bacterium]
MMPPLLNDPEVYPSDEVLKSVLGRSHVTYKIYLDTILEKPFSLVPEWKYYKDGHAWLCKISRKKKTVHWLSIWPAFFKVGYYFTKKGGDGILQLNIDESIKKAFSSNKPIGKLMPIAIDVRYKKQLSDCYKMVVYKINKK